MKTLSRVLVALIIATVCVKPGFAQTELITDGGFDDNSGVWKFESSPGASRAGLCSGDAFSAPKSGCINGNRFLDGEGAIIQSLSFPTCVISCTLKFYYHIVTDQNVTPRDYLYVTVTDLDNSSTVSKLLTLSNVDAHSAYVGSTQELSSLWVEYLLDNMSKPALVFHGINVSGLTAFQIDNVSLIVTRDAPEVNFSVFGIDPDSNHFTIAPNTEVSFVNETKGLPTSYLWKFYNGAVGTNYLTSTAKEPFGTPYSKPGKYSISLTASNEMGTATRTKVDYIHVTANTGIETIPEAASYVLTTYPNPVLNTLNIELKDDAVKQESRVTIINQIGEVVVSETIPAHTPLRQYDFSKLSSGFYMIYLQTDGTILTQKVVKE